MIDLVIAVFKEDLAWIAKVPPAFRIWIYDKSGEGFSKEIAKSAQERSGRRFRGDSIGDLNYRELPNIGREAHTYLRHIISRYDQLSNQTVFCQGHPFDHAPDFHEKLINLGESPMPVAFQWFGFIIDTDDKLGERLYRNWSKNPEGHLLPMEMCYNRLFDSPCPEWFHFYCGAQFVVSKECIASRPIDFYRQALKIVEGVELAPHCFERMWDQVFGVVGVPPQLLNGQKTRYLKKIRKLEE